MTITNTSSTPIVGFFLRADIRRGTASGTELSGDNQVASGLWNDNDITLWPGESQTLSVTYKAADLRGATPVVSVSRLEHRQDRRGRTEHGGRLCRPAAAANAPGVQHIAQ